MVCSCGLKAVSHQFDRPNWDPLLEVAGERVTDTFMWMRELKLADGTRVQSYKHVYTRCYLYLADGSRAFEEAPCGTYVPKRLDFALEAALCNWWFLAGWDDEDASAIKEAILKANEESSKPDYFERLQAQASGTDGNAGP